MVPKPSTDVQTPKRLYFSTGEHKFDIKLTL